MARFLHQVSGIELAAQEDAARLPETTPHREKPPPGRDFSARARPGAAEPAAFAMQRRLLARNFRRTVFTAPAHRIMAVTDSRRELCRWHPASHGGLCRCGAARFRRRWARGNLFHV